MAARGPDDAGTFYYRSETASVAFGHRRLSIIDLSSLGHQPMSTADGSLWITYNGEVFNYKELKEELLETDKYQFRSGTDTEVILYGVREWGLEGCLARLRGMYAFALFDKLSGKLMLVRDPLGVKPLYYASREGTMVFASEIKALLAMPGMERRIDRQALFHYLTFANSPAPHTLFAGINKLEAGTYMEVGLSGEAKTVRYWDPTDFRTAYPALSEQEYVSEIRRLLRQSVERRMVSDVPFGVFLSGGVDSSLNVALMAELMERPVETFSIGIEGDPSNEFIYAREVAKRFGANHHETLINENDFISFLPKMAFFLDEPLADPVSVPLYYVSKLARDSGTIVIQVGEGSDELFAGYGMYHLFDKWNRNAFRYLLKTPKSFRHLLFVLARRGAPSHVVDVLKRAWKEETLFVGNAIAFWDTEKEELLLEGDSYIDSARLIAELAGDFGIRDSLAEIIQIELKNRLPELLLMRVDKMSMANSIETRVPFLDEDLVRFALTIPSALKGKEGKPKYILKKAAEGIIPDEIIYRKKWGFCGSATNMVTDKLATYAQGIIMENPLMKELFHREYLFDVFRKHRTQKRFNSFKIWNLLNLALWYDCWFN
jgi:asparagine synthase (glutamine-hydrolysing)